MTVSLTMSIEAGLARFVAWRHPGTILRAAGNAMTGQGTRRNEQRGGFLARLRTDIRGNTMAMLAASLIPLIAMVGGGLDASRLYLAKTRLQQACDAGALAGRKVMGGGTWDYNSFAARTAANKFFEANFAENDFGTNTLTKEYSEAAGTVKGAASVVVPMTLMKVVNMPTKTLTVACDAEMRLPNTDVMFVLDNTGSMSQTLSGDTRTKITALKEAVKCFFEIVARQDTNVDCDGGAPSGGLSDQVQVRFGFAPYDMNVNVGKILKQDWMADSWTYQSRQVVTTPQTIYDTYTNGTGNVASSTPGAESVFADWGAAGTTTPAGTSETDCQTNKVPVNTNWAKVSETSATGTTYVYSASEDTREASYTTKETQRRYEYRYVSFASKKCTIQRRELRRIVDKNWTRPDTGVPTVKQVFAYFRYAPATYDVSGLKKAGNPDDPWNSTVSLPNIALTTKKTLGGKTYYLPASANATWPGCTEERQTVRANSYDPIPSDAYDLDIDRVPDSDTNTKWKPLLPAAVFTRGSSSNSAEANFVYDPVETTATGGVANATYTCLKVAARKLQKWPDVTQYDAYVDSMVPAGNTYHDIGLLWGARLLSPTGLFASENAKTPSGGEIERHLIFMTDGDACTETYNYAAYGIAWYDRRQTDPTQVPTSGCDSDKVPGTLTDQVTARYTALCQAVRNKNITLWVIWFGAKLPAVEARLNTCATPGRFFAARNSTDLQRTFRSIANQISQLRLTQ
jgi:Flp pilus assembly protein TadG